MRKIGGGPLQRKAAQLHDQSGLLGMGDEVARRDQALDGMLPAQQRLKTRHGAVGQPDDGLVENIELVGGQGMAQFAFQRHAVAGRQHFQLGGIDPGAGAALPLGGDQRQFGILDQGKRVLALRSGGHARRCRARRHFTPVHAIGLPQASASALPIGWGARRGLAKQKSETVAADAEDLRRLAQPGQPIGQHVAGCCRRRHRPGWHEWP